MEIFKLYGKVLVDTSATKMALQKLGDNVEKVSKGFLKGVSTVAKFGVAVGAVVGASGAAMYGMAKKTADATDRIDKLSQKLGLSRKGFQELDFVLSQSGVNIDTFQSGMKSLLKNMDGVANSNKNAIKNFKKLGVVVVDSSGKIRKQEDVLKDTIKAFQKMENSSEKARLAQEIFGRQGQELMPLLNAQAGSFENLSDKANKLGLILDDKTIDAGVVFTDTLDQAKRALDIVAVSIGAEVMPVIQEMLVYIIEHMPQIREVMGQVFGFIKIIVLETIAIFKNYLIPAISRVVQYITINCAYIYKVIKEVLDVVAPYVSSIFNSLKNIVIGVTNIIMTFWRMFGDDIMKVAKSAFDYVYSVISGVFELIKNIFEVFGNLLQGNWKGTWDAIVKTVVGIFNTLLSMCKASLDTMLNIVKFQLDLISKPFTALGGLIVSAFSTALNSAKNIASNSLNAIKNTFVNVFENIKNVVQNAINKIRGFFNFSWSLPRLKLPHISISGGFNIFPPRAPRFSVSWYKKAMDTPYLFTQPTIFPTLSGLKGAGEAGDEIMYGRNNLLNDIRMATMGDEKVSKVEMKLDKLIDLLNKLLILIRVNNNTSIVLDTGALVGSLAPSMDSALGNIYTKRKRGTL